MAKKPEVKRTPPPAASLKRPNTQEQKAAVPAQNQSSSTGVMVPGNLSAVFAEDAQENLKNVHDAFFRVSFKGSRYSVSDSVIGNKGIEFEAIILKETPVNVFYLSKYDPSNPTNPDCWSLGGLKPDEAVEKKQNDSCITCPNNRFGTGTDREGKRSKGKACKNARRLVLKVEGVDMPVLLNLPPTSIKSLNAYLKMLSSNKPPVPMFAAKTLFGFLTGKDYPCPILSLAGIIDTAEEYAAIREYRNSQVVIDALNAYASPADLVEETEGQAQSNMDSGEDGSF